VSGLLSAEFLRRLERLAPTARRASASPFKGEHASARQGRSVEFSDFRDYSPGDDFRHIDWNAYGRLERLFLKLFREESEYAIYVLLDTSASMGLAAEKARYAKQVAAALTYISLCNFDRVLLGAVDARVVARHGPMRGRAQALPAFKFLEELPFQGVSNLNQALRDFTKHKHRRGIAIVISDFLQEEDPFDGLKALRGQRHEVFAVQVLEPDELEPAVRGDLKLIDVETRAEQEVTVSETVLSAYRRVLDQYVEGLRSRCARYGLGYALAPTSRPLEDLVFETLRRERLLA